VAFCELFTSRTRQGISVGGVAVNVLPSALIVDFVRTGKVESFLPDDSPLPKAIEKLESLGYTINVIVYEQKPDLVQIGEAFDLKKTIPSGVVGANIALSTSRAANKEETKKREEIGPRPDRYIPHGLPHKVSRRHLLTTVAASAASGALIGHNYGNLINNASKEEIKKLIEIVSKAGYKILPPNSITSSDISSASYCMISALGVYNAIRIAHMGSVTEDLREKYIKEQERHKALRMLERRSLN